MSNVYIFDHPLIKHKISILRNKETSVKDFKEVAHEIALFMGFEVTKDLNLVEFEVETPIAKTVGYALERQVAIVPILRAGLGMVDAFMQLLPAAKVGHIGLARNEETLEPEEYYCKMPKDLDKRQIIVVDPMLATGGSAAAAINFIKARGGKNIKFACIIAAPQGIEFLKNAHPDVDIYVSTLDEKLNEHGYIVPGLGDAGDRLFGTL